MTDSIQVLSSDPVISSVRDIKTVALGPDKVRFKVSVPAS
jgi:hypothetical protein